MLTIDALGADGHSILPDLQGASPTGGLVTSESRPCQVIAVGQLVRHHGWSVVGGIIQDGVTGLCHLALIDAGGEVSTRTVGRGQSVEVRTDAMISPDSLFKLPRDPEGTLASCLQATGEAATSFAAMVAGLPGNGEAGDGESPWAVDTLERLIGEARALLGQQPPAGGDAPEPAAVREADLAAQDTAAAAVPVGRSGSPAARARRTGTTSRGATLRLATRSIHTTMPMPSIRPPGPQAATRQPPKPEGTGVHGIRPARTWRLPGDQDLVIAAVQGTAPPHGRRPGQAGTPHTRPCPRPPRPRRATLHPGVRRGRTWPCWPGDPLSGHDDALACLG